jgi:hypothetical protein
MKFSCAARAERSCKRYKMPNNTQKSLWLCNKMHSSVLPMMLCLRQLGWKRNLGKACPGKPFWVKKGQERSCKRYKMPKPAYKKLSEWKRLRKCHARFQTSHKKVYDCVTRWILACYRWCFACANWDERGILLRPAQENLSEWKRVRKGHASGTRCKNLPKKSFLSEKGSGNVMQDAKHHTTKSMTA